MQRVPNIDATKILKAVPGDLKPKGAAKLPDLLLIQGNQIPQIIEPSIISLIEQYIPPDIVKIALPIVQNNRNNDKITITEEQKASITQQIKTLVENRVKEEALNAAQNEISGVCLPPNVAKQLIDTRNNIVQSLNSIGTRIDQASSLVTGVSNFLTILVNVISLVDTALTLATLFYALPPNNVLPTPGSITSTLSGYQKAIRTVTFDQYGNSKLARLQSTIASSALVLSIVSIYILQAKALLEIIDIYIKACQLDNNNPLTPTSDIIESIASAQLQASQTQNQVTYNGFIIEIEEIPYSPGVIRRRAIGKNQQGIVLIQTELSFTTDNQTLINELKLIIDRDNLKAY